MIKNIIAAGVGAAVGYAVGISTKKEITDVQQTHWKGPEHEIVYNVGVAERLLDNIDSHIEEGSYSDHPYIEDDIRRVRIELMHEIPNTKNDPDKDAVKIKVCDRERLSMFDTVMSSNLSSRGD